MNAKEFRDRVGRLRYRALEMYSWQRTTQEMPDAVSCLKELRCEIIEFLHSAKHGPRDLKRCDYYSKELLARAQHEVDNKKPPCVKTTARLLIRLLESYLPLTAAGEYIEGQPFKLDAELRLARD